jgi:mannose-6-phosphate isomerase-like protein (cupin superfamily)
MLAGLPAFAALVAKGAATPLANTTVNLKDAKLTREPFGDQRIYFDGPTGQLHAMTAGSLKLKAGMSPHPPHEHPEEEFMVVAEGTGRIVVDGKTTEVGPGSIMYAAGGHTHGVVAGPQGLLFYFFKWKA